MKWLLFFLSCNIYASAELPKINLGDIYNTINCLQGQYSCACCEEFFGKCKKFTEEIFEGYCIDADFLIYELRLSPHVEEITIP